MSVLNGGIFSNPRGKTAGIVFGAARTRTGKKVTARQLVPPSNPNTAAQQTQRGKFAEAIAIVRLIGASIYQTDWNRAIGQLPGFQSLESVFLNALDSSFDIGTIPPINLGSLHMSNTFGVATSGTTMNLNITWSTENGLNGTSADVLTLLAVETSAEATPLERDVVVDQTNTRGALGSYSLIVNKAATNYSVLGYFVGAGTAEGLISPTKFGQADSGT